MAQIAGYTFNEGAGTTAAEVAGGLTITGVPGWATGRNSNAMFCNLVTGPNFSPFTVDTAFTIMFDAYMEGDGGSGYNIFMSNVDGIGNIQCDSTGNLEWYHNTGTSGNIAVLSDLTWYNISLVATGTQRRVLLDGTQVTSYANTATSTTGAVKIGGDLGGGYTANFRFDNLRIFDTALSNSEIASLAGTPTTVYTAAAFVDLSDNIGVADSLTRTYDGVVSVTTNLADSIGITDMGSQQTLDVSQNFDDPAGITDVLTALLNGLGSTTNDTEGISDVLTASLTSAPIASESKIFYSDGTNWYAM